MAIRMQIRRGAAAEWTSANPVLAEGEAGLETDSGNIKYGNGVDPWEALPYHSLTPSLGEVIVGGTSGPVGRVLPATTAGIGAENLTPATMAKWRKALARVRLGTQDAKLLCVGDSTTWGSKSGNVATKSYPPLLATALNGRYIRAQNGLQIPAYDSDPASHDTRWTFDPGWARERWGFTGHFGQASYMDIGGGAGPITFTPGHACDTFRVWYQQNTDLGTIHLSVDGEPAVSQSTSGTLGWGSAVVTSSLSDSHVLSITATAATVAVVGVEAYDATRASVLVGRAGVPGSKTSDWVTIPSGASNGITEYAPDLTIISLGINDSRASTPVPLATYIANMTTLITWAKASGDVVLLTPFPSSNGTTAQLAMQESYFPALRDLAYAEGCGFVDIASRFVSGAVASATGLLADGVHPTDIGYADAAGGVASALMQV